MSIEKNKERLIKRVALSDEELEMVSGGEILKTKIACPFCGQSILAESYEAHCAVCGKVGSDLFASTPL